MAHAITNGLKTSQTNDDGFRRENSCAFQRGKFSEKSLRHSTINQDDAQRLFACRREKLL